MEKRNYWLDGSSEATCMDKLKKATLGFIDRRFDAEDIIELYDDVIRFVTGDELHIVMIMEGFESKTPTRNQFEALLVELAEVEKIPADCAIFMDCAQYHILDPESRAILRFVEDCRDFGCVIDHDARC